MYNLKGLHELRTTYACERYEQITNILRPLTVAIATNLIIT